jgi:hypothetical protein
MTTKTFVLVLTWLSIFGLSWYMLLGLVPINSKTVLFFVLFLLVAAIGSTPTENQRK